VNGSATVGTIEQMSTEVATADQLLAMPDDGWRYELVHGELRRMAPAGFEHGAIGMRLVTRLGTHVEASDLGVVLGPDTGFSIASDPDTVRAPDVSFVRRDRIPEGGLPKGYWRGAPDLAVEVISPGDTYSEVESKVEEWLGAGTRLVVVLNPRSSTATVYRSRSEVVRLLHSDDLDLGAVVRGFTCPVADLMR
jgi:Uma2 family endonuclease